MQSKLAAKLEPSEREYYTTLWSQADSSGQGKIAGKEAVQFFQRSGLPVEILKQIWLACSTNNKTLDKEEFFVSMRMIAYAQNRIPPTKDSILSNIKAPLPKFNAGKPGQPQTPSYLKSTGSPYDVTADSLQKYEAYFDTIDQKKIGLMTGEQAKDVFTQSELDEDTLFAIWQQCDGGDKGCLDRAEFLVAVHLMALVRKGVPLLPQLPPTLRNFMTEYQKTTRPKQELIERSEKMTQAEAAGEQYQSPTQGYQEQQSPQKIQSSTKFGSNSRPQSQIFDAPVSQTSIGNDSAPKNEFGSYSTATQEPKKSAYDFGRSALEDTPEKKISFKEDLSIQKGGTNSDKWSNKDEGFYTEKNTIADKGAISSNFSQNERVIQPSIVNNVGPVWNPPANVHPDFKQKFDDSHNALGKHLRNLQEMNNDQLQKKEKELDIMAAVLDSYQKILKKVQDENKFFREKNAELDSKKQAVEKQIKEAEAGGNFGNIGNPGPAGNLGVVSNKQISTNAGKPSPVKSKQTGGFGDFGDESAWVDFDNPFHKGNDKGNDFGNFGDGFK